MEETNITFSSTQDVIDIIPTLSEHHIKPLVKYLNKTPVACKSLGLNPFWFIPLFSTTIGWRILCQLTSRELLKAIFYKRAHVMLACLLIQKSFGSLQNVSLAINVLNKLVMNLISPGRCVNAILHYIHPDHVHEIDQLYTLLPQSTQSSTAPQPLHEQFTIPEGCFQRLFPRFDTTQISQCYAWLLYLLSTVYAPITYASYNDRSINYFPTQINAETPASFLPTFNLQDAFIHVNLFNSFDEYLAFKLPALTTESSSTTTTLPSTTFSYFTTPHPCSPSSLPPPVSAQFDTKLPIQPSTQDEKFHLLILFLLGTSLLAHHHLEFYSTTTYEQLVAPFDALLPDIIGTTPALDYQISAYKYRKYLLTNDFQLLQHHFEQTQTQPLKTTPPHFSHPYFPFTLSCLSSTWMHRLPVAQAISFTALQDNSVVYNVIHSNIEILLLQYLTKHRSPNLFDAYFVSYGALSTLAQYPGMWTIDNIARLSNAFSVQFVDRSWQMYLAGKDTLHTRLYLEMLLRPTTCSDFGHYKYVLFTPFITHDAMDPFIQKHIILCAAAGLLNPITPQFNPSMFKMSTSHIDNLPQHLSQSVPIVHRELTPFRAFVYSYLVRTGGYEVYFTTNCAKYDFLLELVPAMSSYGPIPQLYKDPDTCLPHYQDLSIKFLPDPLEQPENKVHFAQTDNDGKIVRLRFSDEVYRRNTYDPFDGEGGTYCIEDDSYCQKEMFLLDHYYGPTFFDINPYGRPKLNVLRTLLINNDENQMTLKSTRAIRLQNDYMKYFKSLTTLENDIVTDTLDKVLYFSEVSGLLNPETTRSPSSSPPPSYPFPDLLIFHDKSGPSSLCLDFNDQDLAMDKKQQFGRWATELLMVCALNLQPFQPLKMDSNPGTIEFESYPSTPPISQQSLNYTLNPQSKAERLIRLRDTIIDHSRLSLFDITATIPPYQLTPAQMTERYTRINQQTKSGYLFDCCLDAIFSPIISFYQSLEDFVPPQ